MKTQRVLAICLSAGLLSVWACEQRPGQGEKPGPRAEPSAVPPQRAEPVQKTEQITQRQEDLSRHVRPFVGTHHEGNTYPGAVAPFGMVQVSPDTDKTSWGAASGYEYSDDTLLGFSLTHLSGTGIPDLGDILFIPSVGPKRYTPGEKKKPDTGYCTRFSHDKESASPGYYSVHLPEHDITAELTATERAGMMRLTFPRTDAANIVVDLSHVLQWKAIWSNARFESDTLVTGMHQVKGWAKERYVFFAAEFSKPFDDFGILQDGKKVVYDTRRFRSRFEAAGPNLQLYATYTTAANEAVLVKVGISALSTANAKENLDAEIPHWDFEKVRAQTRAKWDEELARIEIEADDEEKETFYTALYHAFLTPTLYEDADGTYRGLDQNAHTSDGFTNYAIFSLWDTYRAVHPLFALIQAGRNADMINSMLAHYDQSTDQLLPVWSLNNNETWCMIGYHSVSVIADAYLKGVEGFDAERAYEAVRTTASNPDYDSVKVYSEIGYVPFDQENEAVSKTLEYAYDDFCIARMARALGKEDDYQLFAKRATAYENLFDPTTSHMRGKDSEGNWREPFTPDHFVYWGDFTEGTSRQYTFYVPHDVQGLIRLMGSKEEFTAQLDALFETRSKKKREGTDDIHGRIGEYWHGNEPSHHIAFLYNYVGQPWKTQELVHRIMTSQYGNRPDSLSGNDDCGQMSAWYLFNALGFYPVCPGCDYYVIGTPRVQRAVVHLSNGNDLTVTAKNLSDQSFYIQSVRLNGKPWDKTYLPFAEIQKGGALEFLLGKEPNKSWGVSQDSAPPSCLTNAREIKPQ